MTTQEMEALFALTLAGDYADDEPSEAVSAIHRDGNREVFEYAGAWCLSEDPLKRARGAAVLAQLRRAGAAVDRPERLYRDESYPLIARILEVEQPPMVLEAVIAALGHSGNVEAVPGRD